MWKLTPAFPSRDRSALTAVLNSSAVDGTTINFSPFSWAIRLPGHDARNQARKERVSLKPEIKMGILLGRSPAGRQALATWAFEVVPSGMPLRGPDMSLAMRLLLDSIETPGSDGFPSRHLNKSIHSTSHVYQICQLTNGRAGRTARSLCKKGHVSSLRSFNAYIKKEIHQ